MCVSIREKVEGRLTCGVTGETRPLGNSRGTLRWSGLCVTSIRNKAAGWLAYRVTGKIRLQDDGNQVHQRNKAVGGRCTTSFEEWRGAEPMRWGWGSHRGSTQPESRFPTWGRQQLPVRLFLVHHLHFMVG